MLEIFKVLDCEIDSIVIVEDKYQSDEITIFFSLIMALFRFILLHMSPLKAMKASSFELISNVSSRKNIS